MGEIKVTASVGARRLTLDPIAEHTVDLPVREVESTIPAGFQQVWGEGEIDGQPFEITAGAGFGSRWGTITLGGKSYVYSVDDIVKGLYARLQGEGS